MTEVAGGGAIPGAGEGNGGEAASGNEDFQAGAGGGEATM